MTHSISLSSTLLVIVLVFLLPLIRSDDLINRTCKKTPYYDLCVSSLQSNSQASSADVKGLASTMANITLSNATHTLYYSQEIIDQNTNPELERALTYCAEVYIPIVDYILPQAIDGVRNGHFGFFKYGILDAEEKVQACDKKIPDSVKLPLTEMNRVMQNLCNVSVALIKILLKG
ncbi:cell wall / vacuolar inhibitor of fructosidase 1 [Ricinus communis]|uniref:Enzyme inhibitor, putative n=1 Tax=Ricinus communis TaxID=3988 RepID=B9RZT6_RICCO|nr:cell wall / vacuolar inhibitor of fructosidase 1 [Ricinus communis]EEF43119.1 enzyme inhibitor, putative [Ricinus communis]|eukprot:XP_002519255.1 cell wall / vacuolar inhibitor of fructosidase 1 [Ricinus communis]